MMENNLSENGHEQLNYLFKGWKLTVENVELPEKTVRQLRTLYYSCFPWYKRPFVMFRQWKKRRKIKVEVNKSF